MSLLSLQDLKTSLNAYATLPPGDSLEPIRSLRERSPRDHLLTLLFEEVWQIENLLSPENPSLKHPRFGEFSFLKEHDYDTEDAVREQALTNVVAKLIFFTMHQLVFSPSSASNPLLLKQLDILDPLMAKTATSYLSPPPPREEDTSWELP
ncbi:MAG: hypothetical protein KBC64_00575 [Simkaniaceae bacterium]|nr:hypothetical protein [Simkaniaceae bacterium]